MSGKNTILRRYICKRLAEYYAQPADNVVGCTSQKNINFPSLFNEWHWKQTYKRVYNERQGMWLTPVELFRPYYSNVLANFVSTSITATMENLQMDSHTSFEIVELGGGRGTNAKALLDHMKDYHSDMYERLDHYTIFDTSTTLHELQRNVLIDDSVHAGKVKLKNVDMMDVAEGKTNFLPPADTPTALITLELLDNLPHDKIGRCIETGDILQAEVMPMTSLDIELSSPVDKELLQSVQHWNHLDTSQPYTETFSPINDPILQTILSVAPSVYTPLASHGPRWVPTVALGILMKLFECRPNSSVAFADFDWLPRPDLEGSSNANQYGEEDMISMAEPAVGDPIVTDMNGNDHLCYLTSPPDALCDILFPTDFGKLATFTDQLHQLRTETNENELAVSASAMKQNEFLMKYGSDEVNKTKGWTGYSPMLEDFGNCSVLTVTPDLNK